MTESTTTLDTMAPGTRGSVARVIGDEAIRRRLMELGFCGQAEVEVIRRAPFGDPIEVRVRGYLLSLRSEQAAMVRMHLGTASESAAS